MRIENGYLIFDEEKEINKLEFKKINGHNFVELVGLNQFSKVGDTLIKMFGFVKEEIDKKWLIRGDFAEQIVKSVYTRDGHICTTYDKEKINYDNFQDNKYFSGVIDIELLDENTLIEVKSKSMKDYDKILKYPPKNEIYQGLMYGFLRNYNHIIMEWIFFDEQTENEIFVGKNPTTLKNLKKEKVVYNVDREEMKALMNNAYKIVKDFVNTKKISLDLISEKTLEKLGILKKDVDLDDLPF